MKKHLRLPMAIIIFAGVVTIGATAQTVTAQRVVANIPFTFTAGKTTLPAGKYAITVLNPNSDRKILQIRSFDGRASVMIQTTGVQVNISDDAKLVFHRYGDRYFFAQAQMAGDSTSLAAIKSNSERKKQIAASKHCVVVITAG